MMEIPETLIPLAALVCGTTLAGLILHRIFCLAQTWISRNKTGYKDEAFNRLAKAFTQYKKDTERRLQNLEAIITDEDQLPFGKKLEQQHPAIEIEEAEEEKTDAGNNNLRNMLRE